MLKHRRAIIILSVIIPLLVWQKSAISAETWHLTKGQEWKPVSAEAQDKYLLKVAEIKRQVNMGQTKVVYKSLAELKRDFPEITGPDLEAFVKAEMQFCKGNFAKAIRAYDSFLDKFPESELYEAALDREFSIGKAFLAGRKKTVLGIIRIKGYAEGEKIMEKIADRAGESPIGMRAALSVAKNYEERKMFDDGYQKWSEISTQWPTGQIGQDALWAMARCKYNAYRGARYDASDLVSAKSYYKNFKERYPEVAAELEVDKTLEKIDVRLAEKELSIGQYYQKAGHKQAAGFYYQMVAANWPGSEAANRAKEIMDRNIGDKETKQ